MSNELDIITGEPHNKREVKGLNKLVTDLDLHDPWRISHRDTKEYTWSRNHPFIARRIDYIFVSGELLNFTEQTDITTLLHSDHRAVTTSIVFHKYKRGPSYWKLNNSLLKDSAYVECINRTIDIFKQKCTEDIDPHNKWELCKIKIRETSQFYSKNKQQQKRNKLTDLRSRLNIIEQSLATQPHNKELQTEMTKHKTDLEVHAMAQAHGTQTRARLKFIEEGLSLIHI
eukprot:TRINITY_DN45049_c0_g1_i1.p1 TRINITY_DN45049_c0_g1~~TRINITY_DN45049_c0_g1_i1.p1  ORF type:complete len:229 (-),score=24.33 TRINITY_DN45049_c0_g1_i1:29-715(-)